MNLDLSLQLRPGSGSTSSCPRLPPRQWWRDQTYGRAGVLVIDVGAGVTDLALYRNGNVAYTGVVPVGGDHLTGDLVYGVKSPGALCGGTQN